MIIECISIYISVYLYNWRSNKLGIWSKIKLTMQDLSSFLSNEFTTPKVYIYFLNQTPKSL